MSFLRKLVAVSLLTSTLPALAVPVLLQDNFSYPSAAAFSAQWTVSGWGLTYTPGTYSVTLGNTLAVRSLPAGQYVRPQQAWTLSCAIAQTSFQRGQWFGLFTADMCHGYLMRWDSSFVTSFSGNGFYALYKYDSTVPISTWNPNLGTPLVTGAGVQSALATTPTNFTLGTSWDATTNQRVVTLNVPSVGGSAPQTLQVEVPDADQRAYTSVALSGNTNGIFSNLQLSTSAGIYNARDYGAVGDGVTDDTAAINSAIAAAETAGGSVYLPGTAKSYLYSSCLAVSGITFYGDGDSSLLQATDPHNSAIIVSGDHTSVMRLKIISPNAGQIGRQSTPQTGGVMINGATNFTLSYLTIDTTASVGIISLGGSGTAAAPSTISNCSVANTLADGIHLTYQSRFISVLNNSVTNPGDDMYAVVSYTEDGGLSHDISIVGNYGYRQSANGRGISVVGGQNVSILNNNIQNTTGAGVYLQSELTRSGSTLVYKTYGDDTIRVQGNVLYNTGLAIHHAGINLGGRAADTTDAGQVETSDMLISNVSITGNTITNSTYSGLSLQGYFENVSISGNTIDTTGQQGLEVFGGNTLLVGTNAPNTFKNIGQYGIYLGFNSSIPTLTTGKIDIVDNGFYATNVRGTFAIPVISIGLPSISGIITGNIFNLTGSGPTIRPYVRYGVE